MAKDSPPGARAAATSGQGGRLGDLELDHPSPTHENSAVEVPTVPPRRGVGQHRPARARPKIFGGIDALTELAVHGWAIDLREPDVPTRLEVLANGRSLGFAECAEPREDLRSQGLPFDWIGFCFPLPDALRDGERHAFEFHAVSGAVVELFSLEEGVRRSSWEASFPLLRGHVELITDEGIRGWAYDPNSPRRPVPLQILVDRQPIGVTKCNGLREGLGGIDRPGAAAQFTFRLPRRFFDGRPHVVELATPEGRLVELTDHLGGRKRQTWSFRQQSVEVLGYVDGLRDRAIRGWAIVSDRSRNTMAGRNEILVTSRGRPVAQLTADQLRPDVADAVGCDPNCGFAFAPPPEFLFRHSAEFRFVVLPHDVELHNSPFTIDFLGNETYRTLGKLLDAVDDMVVQFWNIRNIIKELLPGECYNLAQYDDWARRYLEALQQSAAARRDKTPRGSSSMPAPDSAARLLVSIVCPAYQPRLADFRAAVASVLAQTHENWELIIVDDASGSAELEGLIRRQAEADPRIKPIFLDQNVGVSAATNRGVVAAKGDYIAFLDHDDLLVPTALEIMTDAAFRTGAKILYSDEDKVDDYCRFSAVHLKPDWNYRLLLSYNYISHLTMIDRHQLARIGGLRPGYDGAQDHDLLLRLAEITEPSEIVHVPEILYHWRITAKSTAASAARKPYAVSAGRRSIADALARKRLAASVVSIRDATLHEVRWKFTAEPKVTIVIPYRDQIAITRSCVEAIIADTRYRNLEIILVDNWSTSTDSYRFCEEIRQEPRIRVLRAEEQFNFSRLNNMAERQSSGEFLLFMNNDVFIKDPKWLRTMVDEALADDRVGIVGIKLMYPNGLVQHGGVVLGVGGIADHAHRGLRSDEPGYMWRAVCAQEISAVTGACMLCRRKAFEAVGGFDEAALAIAFNDVDLCLKVRAAGYRIIWTPATLAEHSESLSRGSDFRPDQRVRFFHEDHVMRQRWGKALDRDPFYNPHFSRLGGLYADLGDPKPVALGEDR